MRQANPIDFWRGFALLSIFVNHIPGIYWEQFTHRNVSLSDSAELFVFLAGWSLRHAAEGRGGGEALHRVVFRLMGRAVTIYAAQIFLTTLAIAFIAATALVMNTPLVLEWNNAAAVFSDPVRAHVGIMLLTHQLGYFDILPLYVVMMSAAPLIVLIDRVSRTVLVALSLTIYLSVLATSFVVPTWPVEGVWFFNPFAWQIIFVAGFVLSREATGDRPLARVVPHLRWIAWPLVIAGLLVVRLELAPDPLQVPTPTLLFIADKSFLTPLRLLQFFALAVAFAPLYHVFARWFSWLVAYFTLLGRNALNVFCVGSLAALGGQLARFIFGSGLIVDTVILVLGVCLLGVTAWLSEWRERSRAKGVPSAAS